MNNLSIIASLIIFSGMMIIFFKFKNNKKYENEKYENEKYQFRKKRVLNRKMDFK